MNKLGEHGEESARRFLEGKGFRHLESNFSTRWGELDLILEDGTTLVFVEVKHRRSGGFGSGEESITPSKMKHMERVAMMYVQEQGIYEKALRFDVVAIGPEGLNHYENAFMASGNYY